MSVAQTFALPDPFERCVMPSRSSPILFAFAACLLATSPAHAQPPGTDPRPKETNQLPSDTGVQMTQPSGAVTGAGQPQGTLPQPAADTAGGLEEKARREARSPAANGTPDDGKPAAPKKR